MLSRIFWGIPANRELQLSNRERTRDVTNVQYKQTLQYNIMIQNNTGIITESKHSIFIKLQFCTCGASSCEGRDICYNVVVDDDEENLSNIEFNIIY